VSVALALALLGVAAVASPVPVTIDACVAVDPEEVRRLTAIELLADETDRSGFEVLVGCRGDSQTLRLLHASRGVVDSRSIEASKTAAPDARNRELALAIAELIRRAPEAPEQPPEVAAPPKTVPEAASARIESRPDTRAPQQRMDPARVRAQFAAVAALVHWSAGHRLLGADLVVRVATAPGLVPELRVGVRQTPGAVSLSRDEIDARGFSAALGLGYALLDLDRFVHLTLGGRLGIDGLRYAVSEPSGGTYAGADASDVHALGTANIAVALSERVRVEAEAAAGGALHAIVIRDNGQDVTGARGVMFVGSLGVAAWF
jgi:hypothetical protein